MAIYKAVRLHNFLTGNTSQQMWACRLSFSGMARRHVEKAQKAEELFML